MQIYLILILGVVWRVWDGSGRWLRTTYRNVVGSLVVLYAALVAVSPDVLLSWIAMGIIAALVMLAIIRGYSNWKSWNNVWQYAPSLIAAFIYTDITGDTPGGYIYIGMCLLAGAAHPIATRLDIHTRWAEATVGGLVLGGLPIAALASIGISSIL